MSPEIRDKFMRDIGRKKAYRDVAEWIRTLPLLEAMEQIKRSQEEIGETWGIDKEVSPWSKVADKVKAHVRRRPTRKRSSARSGSGKTRT